MCCPPTAPTSHKIAYQIELLQPNQPLLVFSEYTKRGSKEGRNSTYRRKKGIGRKKVGNMKEGVQNKEGRKEGRK
jgi:hypothetical protein